MLDGIINYDMACKRSKYFRLFYFDDLFDFFTNAKKKCLHLCIIISRKFI